MDSQCKLHDVHHHPGSTHAHSNDTSADNDTGADNDTCSDSSPDSSPDNSRTHDFAGTNQHTSSNAQLL